MIKQIGVYSISFILVSLIGYYLHIFLFPKVAIESPIPLRQVYTFFSVFSLVVCSQLLVLSKSEKYKDQLGFLYLVSIVLKIILFFIVFYKQIFKGEAFTNIEGINLLIPIILILYLEVFFIGKLLKNIRPLKNAK